MTLPSYIYRERERARQRTKRHSILVAPCNHTHLFALPRGGGGGIGVGTHQDTIRSPPRLYKAPTHCTKTSNTTQGHNISKKNSNEYLVNTIWHLMLNT